MMVALITLALMGALGLVGDQMKVSFTKLSTAIQTALARG
jgi:Flp pilus assembly pilin Flp